jgi:CDP-diacylglycerol--serine O-phosphatidyltransferase
MKLRLFSVANILTLTNAFFGCCAMVMFFSGNYSIAVACTILSLLADFLDGFAARKFGASSDLGKQLDSLADVISFGVVPGVAVFTLLNGNRILNAEELITSFGVFDLIPYVGFLIPVFSVLRLAKFNIDERQSDRFIGLATPANTLFWVSYFLLNQLHIFKYTASIFLVIPLIILSCYLLIAEIPMFSFKFTQYGWKKNEVRYFFLFVSIILLLLLKAEAGAVIIPLYILVSVVENALTSHLNNKEKL